MSEISVHLYWRMDFGVSLLDLGEEPGGELRINLLFVSNKNIWLNNLLCRL